MLQEETDQNSSPGKMIIMLCRLGCNIPYYYNVKCIHINILAITHPASFYTQIELQITEQPQSNTSIKYGESVKLSVSATSCGAENLIYLWRKDGETLYNNTYTIGTNTPTLTIREFLPDNQGRYTCQIKNYKSSIESEQADLALGLFISIVLS